MQTPTRSSERKAAAADTSDSAKLTHLLSLDEGASALFTRFRSPTRHTLTESLNRMTLLNLSECNLTTNSFPKDLAYSLPSLEILYLSDNSINTIPMSFNTLTTLRILAVKSCNLTTIPPNSLPPNLQSLIATNNTLTTLPQLPSTLLKLMLSHNNLTAIPPSFANLKHLELLRLSNNHIKEPPIAALKLPRLKWVALGGNPFLPPSPPLPPSTLPCTTPSGPILGSGSGGNVHSHLLPTGPCALKSYSSPTAKLTDGLAVSDIVLSVHLHTRIPACVPPVLGHNDYQMAMSLLPGSAIADPPSSKTLTRDAYHPITFGSADKIVSEVGRVLKHMHGVGVAHGDVYGHNIMHDHEDSTFLTDFGASFCYEKGSEYGRLIERVEMRSYGQLVTDLGERLGAATNQFEADVKTGLEDLRNQIRDSATTTFDHVSPRLYKCKPSPLFASLPKPLRCLAGYLLATTFTLTFLAAPLVTPLLLVPSLYSTLIGRVFAACVVGSYGVSLIAPLRKSMWLVRLGQLMYEPFGFKVSTSPMSRQDSIGRGEIEKYIVCLHPHGIIPLHALLWAAYCDQYLTDAVTGNSLFGFGAAADVTQKVPFLRNWMGALNAGSAKYEGLKEGLKSQHLFLLPGGVAEIFESKPEKHCIVFKNRRGLVKLALETDGLMVPCYVFGATNFFHNLATGNNVLSIASRWLRAGVTVFWGYAGLPLPFLGDVSVILGNTITVKKGDGETTEACLERCHAEYLEEIERIFYEYRTVAGAGGASLEVK